jgi:hypothetical protein
MIDFREYLKNRSLMLKMSEDAQKPANVVQSRNQLMKIARGSIRQHLQRQILEALHKSGQNVPPKPGEII